VATTLRREVIATDSPLRMSLSTAGNALRICRTVAVFMSHQYVSRICVVKILPMKTTWDISRKYVGLVIEFLPDSDQPFCVCDLCCKELRGMKGPAKRPQ
jgi:hypothetical protein